MWGRGGGGGGQERPQELQLSICCVDLFLKSHFVLVLGTSLCISGFFYFLSPSLPTSFFPLSFPLLLSSPFLSSSLPLFFFFYFLFLEPPSFVKKVDPSYLLTPGDSARLQCKIKGSPEIQVSWFKDNKKILESNTHKMSFVNFVAVLDIWEMKVDDSGSYSCEAVNEVGSDSCTTEVVVKGLFFVLLTVTLENNLPFILAWAINHFLLLL